MWDVRRPSIYIFACLSVFTLQLAAQTPDTTSCRVVRSIQIIGNSVTQDHVILREMATQVGDTLSDSKLSGDRDRIYSLGLFNKVTIAHADTASYADVIVTVVERWYIFPYPIVSIRSRSLHTLTYGFGITHRNFLGRNERISAGFSTGYNRSASITYQSPRITDNDDIFLRAALSYRDSHNLENSTIEFRQITHSESFSLGKRFGLFQTVSGTIGYETWQVPDTSLGRTLSTDGTDRFLTLGLRYTYDSRDIRDYPMGGFYFDATATKRGLAGESTVQTLTLASDIRSYLPLNNGMTLALRGFETIAVGGAVPVYHHLFLGSRTTIRGYNRRDYEGEDLVGAQAEVRVPLVAPRFITFNFLHLHQFNTMRFGIYAAAFADAGKIWYRSESFEDATWLSAVGLGLHILLPYDFVLRLEGSFNGLGQFRAAAAGGVSF